MKDMNDAAFESLNWSLFRLLPDLLDDNNGKGARASIVIKFLFFFLLIFLIVGDEAVKLIFRKGFGIKGVHWWKVTLCVLAFGGIGLYMIGAGIYFIFMEMPHQNSWVLHWWTSPVSVITTGLLHTYLAGYLIYNGFIQKRSLDVPEYYRGTSTLLSSLKSKGWSQSRIQNIGEPATLLLASIALVVVNPICSAPLAFCAFSSWIVRIAESFMKMSQVRDVLANRGYQSAEQQEFSSAHY